jgi:hypothetical protein
VDFGLPRCYNEASFTFMMCTVLALCTVGVKGDFEWAYTLLYNNGAAGKCQTTPIAQDLGGEKGSMPQHGYGREGRFLVQGFEH